MHGQRRTSGALRVTPIRRLALALLLLLPPPDATAESCGAADHPCLVSLGAYHALLPEPRGERPAPVVVHLHGAGSSGAEVIANRDLVTPLLARGYVVLAPTGLVRPGRTGGSWSFGSFRQPLRNEAAFLHEVLDDAERRFAVDRHRVLLSGFSVGGSMVWYLACTAPGDFTAFAPVAGGFWRPFPDSCAAPVRLLHTHGWRDQTVPLEGRPLRPGVEQGDIFEGLQLWRRTNGCTGLKADLFPDDPVFLRRAWTACSPGTALELALHQGGHEVPPEWPRLALDWFESLPTMPTGEVGTRHAEE